MIMQNDDYGFDAVDVQPSPETADRAVFPAVGTLGKIRYGYVPLAPRESKLRLDAVHRVVPPAHLLREQHEKTADGELFGSSLYFG